MNEQIDLLKNDGWVAVTQNCVCNSGDKFLVLDGSPTITVSEGGWVETWDNSIPKIIYAKYFKK